MSSSNAFYVNYVTKKCSSPNMEDISSTSSNNSSNSKQSYSEVASMNIEKTPKNLKTSPFASLCSIPSHAIATPSTQMTASVTGSQMNSSSLNSMPYSGKPYTTGYRQAVDTSEETNFLKKTMFAKMMNESNDE